MPRDRSQICADFINMEYDSMRREIEWRSQNVTTTENYSSVILTALYTGLFIILFNHFKGDFDPTLIEKTNEYLFNSSSMKNFFTAICSALISFLIYFLSCYFLKSINDSRKLIIFAAAHIERDLKPAAERCLGRFSCRECQYTPYHWEYIVSRVRTERGMISDLNSSFLIISIYISGLFLLLSINLTVFILIECFNIWHEKSVICSVVFIIFVALMFIIDLITLILSFLYLLEFRTSFVHKPKFLCPKEIRGELQNIDNAFRRISSPNPNNNQYQEDWVNYIIDTLTGNSKE